MPLALCHRPTHPAASRPARTASRAFLSTRQVAVQFDQPLSSFDTSKVTNMGSMFSVRSDRALLPSPESGLLSVHTALRRNQRTQKLFRLPARTSLRIVLLPPVL